MSFTDQIKMMPAVTKHLIIINTLIWLAMELLPGVGGYIDRFGALYYFTSSQFIPSQLVTYMFIHASFLHLFFNMFALFMFGTMIERVLGSQKFLFYYLSCGIGAALVQEGVFALMISHYCSAFDNGNAVAEILRQLNASQMSIYQMGINPSDPAILHLYGLYHTPVVGASGAIFGILLAFAFMFPNVKLYLMFPPIPMKAKVFVLVYAAVELLLGIYNSQADTVAHFAHLGGMLIGLLILLYWRKKHVIGGPMY